MSKITFTKRTSPVKLSWFALGGHIQTPHSFTFFFSLLTILHAQIGFNRPSQWHITVQIRSTEWALKCATPMPKINGIPTRDELISIFSKMPSLERINHSTFRVK